MGINILGYGPKTLANPSTAITLQSGQFQVLPSGQYIVTLGRYSVVQWYDPVSTTWRNLNAPAQGATPMVFTSDGYNYRIINLTGCVVGAVVTTGGTSNTAKNGFWAAGSNATTGVTMTTTAGGAGTAQTATFNVIVSGAVSTTVTVATGGSGYVMPPIVTFSNPPAGGLPATGYATLTAGAVTGVTVTNQGGGYTSAPTVTLTPQFGDPGSGATATAVLVTSTTAGLGQAVLVTMANYGGGYTSVPTITCAGLTSLAATAVCCFAVTTAPTVSSATHYGNIVNQMVYPAQRTAATLFGSMTNPMYTTDLFAMRNGLGAPGTSSSLASQTIVDGGMSQLDVSNLATVNWSSDGTIPAAFTLGSGVSGGVASDVSWALPI